MGQVAIVTGGASGIGAACAATLTREGAKVVVTDVDDTGCQSVVNKISGAGGEAIYLHQDVTIEETCPEVFRASGRDGCQRRNWDPMQGCRDVVGRLTAPHRGEPRWRVPVGEARRACDAPRRRAPSSSCRRLPVSGGRLVWPIIAPQREAYACSRRRSRWNAAEADGIRVNTVHPGVIDTPIWTKLPVSAGSNAPIDPNEVAEAGYRSAGLGRRGISQMACCSSPQMRPAT